MCQLFVALSEHLNNSMDFARSYEYGLFDKALYLDVAPVFVVVAGPGFLESFYISLLVGSAEGELCSW